MEQIIVLVYLGEGAPRGPIPSSAPQPRMKGAEGFISPSTITASPLRHRNKKALKY